MRSTNLIKSQQIKIKNTLCMQCGQKSCLILIKQLSTLSDEDSEYFVKLLKQKASDIFKSSQNEQELIELKKRKAQLETAISNQVKNLREVDENLKRFIQEDVKGLTDELSEIEKLLQKLENSRQS